AARDVLLNGFERTRSGLPRADQLRRDARAHGLRGILKPERPDSIRITILERVKHHAAHDAEDGGAGANAEGEREDSHSRPAFLPREHAERETNILAERVDPVRASHASVSPVADREAL